MHAYSRSKGHHTRKSSRRDRRSVKSRDKMSVRHVGNESSSDEDNFVEMSPPGEVTSDVLLNYEKGRPPKVKSRRERRREARRKHGSKDFVFKVKQDDLKTLMPSGARAASPVMLGGNIEDEGDANLMDISVLSLPKDRKRRLAREQRRNYKLDNDIPLSDGDYSTDEDTKHKKSKSISHPKLPPDSSDSEEDTRSRSNRRRPQHIVEDVSYSKRRHHRERHERRDHSPSSETPYVSDDVTSLLETLGSFTPENKKAFLGLVLETFEGDKVEGDETEDEIEESEKIDINRLTEDAIKATDEYLSELTRKEITKLFNEHDINGGSYKKRLEALRDLMVQQEVESYLSDKEDEEGEEASGADEDEDEEATDEEVEESLVSEDSEDGPDVYDDSSSGKARSSVIVEGEPDDEDEEIHEISGDADDTTEVDDDDDEDEDTNPDHIRTLTKQGLVSLAKRLHNDGKISKSINTVGLKRDILSRILKALDLE